MNSSIPPNPAPPALNGPSAAPAGPAIALTGPGAVPDGTGAAAAGPDYSAAAPDGTATVPDRTTVRYWTIPDAARELGWAERTLRKRIDLENLPVYRPENTKRGILLPDSLLHALRQRPAPSGPLPQGSGPMPHEPAADGTGPHEAVQVLEAKLDGALTAARLHAQRRRDDLARHQAELDREREERAKGDAQLTFLQERLVQAEREGHELRLLMAQSVQAQQQTAHELAELREERKALAAPKPVKWWQRLWSG